MPNLYIGTSGWIYPHWKGIFYPEKLPSKDKLRYFSKHFKTAEINYSFYHLPRPATYQRWYSETPDDFVFAIKASRFITHVKRLKGIKKAWRQFIKNALFLKEKLGPILFQFPSSFKATSENIKRLEKFLSQNFQIKSSGLVRTQLKQLTQLKFAFEFREKSWQNEKIYQLLEKYKSAWVISDSASWPKSEVITADFVYIRMHGSKVLFSSKYTNEELENLSRKIKNWLKQKLDVYCYFNNDAYGYAIENTKNLLKILSKSL